MKTALAIVRWFKAPRWTWQLAAWAFGLAVVVSWFLTGTFFRGLGSVGTLLALWFGFRFVRWVAVRVKATTDKGVPVNVVRMVREVLAERAKFTDADDRWALAMRAQKVIYDGQSPKLHRKVLTSTGDVRASINLAGIGGNLDTINRLAADGTLAGIMHCKEVSVQPTSRLGKATITFYNSPPLARSGTIADLPASGRGRVTFGFAEQGGAASFRTGLSVLAVSATGGGKSTLFKNAFIDMRRDDIPIELFFINPKRMEFAAFKSMAERGAMIGNIKIAGYCETAAEAEAMLRRFCDDMHVRQERLAAMGMVELKHPTPDFPARMVVCDEMADVKATFDKIDKPMPIAISQGRATQDSVFGLAQIAKIETLGTVRDLFALRAGLRMMTPENTKAALGISENDGAPCSRIPLNMPGMGYYVTDDGTVGKFRTAPVSDKEWANVLAGGLPVGMPVNVENIGPECFGYIAPERKSNRVGYVGIAGGLAVERHPVARRRAQHRRYDRVWCVEHQRVENFWKVHIDDTRMTVYKFPSRSAALVWEERTIKELRPKWNVIHNAGNPDSNDNLARRAGMKRRLRDAAGEYREWGREHRAARREELAEAHAGRVARRQAERDQFVQTVTSAR